MTRSGKTFTVVTSAAVAVLVLAATAFVAFAGRASYAARASGAQWRTSLGQPTWSGPLTAFYPGVAHDSEYIPFAVTNIAQGRQNLRSITASIRAEPNGDAETADGADIPGCLASWFVVSIETRADGLPADLFAGGSYRSKLAVTMKDSASNQDACRNASPAVTVTPSSAESKRS